MADFTFPAGFLWGSATSSHQVEGHNTNNDWWVWEQAGRVKEPSGAACEQYTRFRGDFDLAKSLGHSAHRFSVEWSRVEPEEGVFNEDAIAHYQDMVRALRERGIEPVVTLHHFTSPVWLARQGGWLNPKVVDRFTRYAERMARALEARYWTVINEPLVYVWIHYLAGTGPPGEKNLHVSGTVIEHLVRAHVGAYHAIHAARGKDVMVGVATHLQPFLPCRRWWLPDRMVVGATHRVYNLSFIDAVTEGRLKLFTKRPITIPDGRGCMDFLGMHYYGRAFMQLKKTGDKEWGGVRCGTDHHPREVTERNALGWDVYPPGIAEIIRWGAAYKRPIFITENGICATDDAQRERFLVQHIGWVARAMQQGANVIGYLYWSLLDNFEWAEGFGPRFGLIDVDYTTQQRTIRPSARRYADIIRANRVPLPSP